MPIVWKWRRNRVSTLTGKRKSVSARSMAPPMIRKPRWKRWGWKRRGKIDETPFFHVGIKWNCREEERLARVKKLANVDFLHYQDYCPQGPSSRYSGLQEWGYTPPYRPR